MCILKRMNRDFLYHVKLNEEFEDKYKSNLFFSGINTIINPVI